tara:strand:- start:236 stop:1189 length:954 start_codon:yes stop_codon:yes gene_type:complete
MINIVIVMDENTVLRFRNFIEKLSEKTRRRFLFYIIKRRELMKKTVGELKKECERKGLKKGGNKAELASRLLSGKSTTTKQLSNEQEQTREFKEVICKEYGLKCVDDYGTGARNKKENTTADLKVTVVDVEKFRNKFPKCEVVNSGMTVSLKTKGGDFTQGNYGTSVTSILIKNIVGEDERLRGVVERTNAEAARLRKEFSNGEKARRWKDLGSKEEESRDSIKKLYQNMLWHIFVEETPGKQDRIRRLYDFENGRRSDLKCVGKELSFSKLHIIPEGGVEARKHASGSVMVGEFELRAKAEGGVIDKNWKINLGRG